MEIELNNKVYRVERTKSTICPHRVWVEIPQVDFTGRTRTHWRQLSPGPTLYKLVKLYEKYRNDNLDSLIVLRHQQNT